MPRESRLRGSVPPLLSMTLFMWVMMAAFVVLEDWLEGHAEAAHNLRRHLRRHRLLVDEQGWTRCLLLGLPLRLLAEDVGDGGELVVELVEVLVGLVRRWGRGRGGVGHRSGWEVGALPCDVAGLRAAEANHAATAAAPALAPRALAVALAALAEALAEAVVAVGVVVRLFLWGCGLLPQLSVDCRNQCVSDEVGAHLRELSFEGVRHPVVPIEACSSVPDVGVAVTCSERRAGGSTPSLKDLFLVSLHRKIL